MSAQSYDKSTYTKEMKTAKHTIMPPNILHDTYLQYLFMRFFYISAESRQAMHGFISTVKFTETRAYKAVLDKLNQHHYVVILGRPGDGKTTLGLYALHDMHEKEKCVPLMPHPPSLHLLPYLKEDQKVSIFLDDLFGIYSVSGYSISKYTEFRIFSFLSKGNYLVISIRKDIFLQCETNMQKELFKKDVIIDLTEPNLRLLESEKRSMLETVHDITEDSVNKILSHERFSKEQVGFPQCVALMKGSKNVDFTSLFETPLKFLALELTHLFENSRMKFLTLLLAFANNGQLNFDGDQFISPCLYLPSDIEASSQGSKEFRNAADSLVDTYLYFDKEKCRYVVNHETVLEGIAISLWEKMKYQEYFISICPERFLTQLSSKPTAIYFIPSRHITKLFERIYGMLKSSIDESYVTIASINLWNDPATATKFVHYLKSREEQQNMHLKSYEGATLIVYAAMKGRLNLTRLLLKSCAITEDQLLLALNKSSESCHVEVLHVLLSSLHTKHSDLGLFFHAIKGGSLEIFEAIAEQVGVIDYESKRPSLQCFFAGHIEIEVNVFEEIVLSGNLGLLAFAARLSGKSLLELIQENRRLIEFAAYCGSIQLMSHLLDIGGETCPHLLWWAATSGSMEMFKFLMEKGCDFNTEQHVSCNTHMTRLGQNVNELHGACLSGNNTVVMHIFNTKPDFFHMKDSRGCTPALLSPFSYSTDIVRYMDMHGDITYVDIYGNNILHYAAQVGQLDIVKYIFLKYPQLLQMKNKRHETPFLYSGWSGSVEVTEYLISCHCDILETDCAGRTILHNACNGGKLELVKHLVENYTFLLTMRDFTGLTSLHAAGWSGSIELTEYLITCNCDVHDRDKRGRTILQMALQKGKTTLVKHLTENYPELMVMRDDKKEYRYRHYDSDDEWSCETGVKYHIDD